MFGGQGERLVQGQPPGEFHVDERVHVRTTSVLVAPRLRVGVGPTGDDGEHRVRTDGPPLCGGTVSNVPTRLTQTRSILCGEEGTVAVAGPAVQSPVRTARR